MFLEVDNGHIDLGKIHQRGIKEGNIRGAFLYTGEFLDISEKIKESVKHGEEVLKVDIDSEFCITGCKSNKYPFVKLLYSFNKLPEIELISPYDETLIDSNDIFFNWVGKDSDGKFLEYYIEIYKGEELIKKSSWSIQNFYEINLESGNYSWKVYARDNSFLNNIAVSEKYSFEIKGEPLSKPKILSPNQGFLTNAKKIQLLAQTDDGVINEIFLNDELFKRTYSSNINVEIVLTKEGINVIKVVSLRNGESTQTSVTFETKWTSPSTPDFEFKVEDEKVSLKIKNNDYAQAYIYINDSFLKKVEKTSEWISLGDEIYGDSEIGVMLEDEVGNRTEIFYKKFEPGDEILGIGSSGIQTPNPLIPNPSICIYKYNITHRRFESRRCNITPPQILKIENTTSDNRSYRVRLAAVYNPNMIIWINEYRCTLPVICRERLVKRTRIHAKPYTAVNAYINENFTRIREFRKINEYFFTSLLIENTNPTGRRLNLRYHINHGFRYDNRWVDINLRSSYSRTRAIPPARRIPNNTSQRIYRFPFARNIGVTQWHGYTEFQSPHTGIDFGSYREPVYAIGDGIIREAKWDNYSGVCLSGGFFVRIEHNNGMNSVYLHLENFRKSNGRNWRVGERIRRGELIGRSGNTGAYNCQPLGYHLHFELRTNHLQRNHVNPVPYINVNWDNIPTLDHKRYPGRLTGDNPHPTW